MKDFEFYSPTKIIFGKQGISKLKAEVELYGQKVLLVYGGGSIKRNGIYTQVQNALSSFTIYELSGVTPNPKIETVRKGVSLCKENQIECIVAIGGGSTIDCSKAIAAGAYYEKDPWDLILEPKKIKKALPILDILTISATGSETNNTVVISNPENHLKLGFSSPWIYPKVAILNPEFTYTVPAFQTASGSADILSHLFESYFNDDYTSRVHQSMMEGIMKTVIHYAPMALEQPKNYEARANLMWSATMALNGLFRKAFSCGWSCHAMEHTLSAYYDVTHGAGLAVLTPTWMEYVLDEKSQPRFVEFAKNVWGLSGDDEKTLAKAGIEKTKEFLFETLQLPSTLQELGIEQEKLEEMADNAVHAKGKESIQGFRTLTKEDVLAIYKACY